MECLLSGSGACAGGQGGAERCPVRPGMTRKRAWQGVKEAGHDGKEGAEREGKEGTGHDGKEGTGREEKEGPGRGGEKAKTPTQTNCNQI